MYSGNSRGRDTDSYYPQYRKFSRHWSPQHAPSSFHSRGRGRYPRSRGPNTYDRPRGSGVRKPPYSTRNQIVNRIPGLSSAGSEPPADSRKRKEASALQVVTDSLSNLAGPVYFDREGSGIYRFLSPAYDSPFVVDGWEYRSVEMWLQVQRARFLADERSEKKLLQRAHARQHRAIGRDIVASEERLNGWKQGMLPSCQSKMRLLIVRILKLSSATYTRPTN
jgi:hypothetical protein